jgi:hypothetical protein
MKQRITLVPANITDVTMCENEQYVEVVIAFVATDTPYRIRRTFIEGDNKEQEIGKYNEIYENIVQALLRHASIVQIEL